MARAGTHACKYALVYMYAWISVVYMYLCAYIVSYNPTFVHHRSVNQICDADLDHRSVMQIYDADLLHRSVKQICEADLHHRSVIQICDPDL